MTLEDELSRMNIIDLLIAGGSAYAGYALANGSHEVALLAGIGGTIACRTALNAARGAIRSSQERASVTYYARYGARSAAIQSLSYAGAGLLGGALTHALIRMF